MKTPPNNTEAEQSILSTCMLNERACADAIGEINADEFYNTAHRVIFASIVELFKKNVQIDLVTLMNELKENGELDKVGGVQYLSQLSSIPSSARVLPGYIKIVKDCAIARKIITISTEAAEDCYNSKPIDLVIDELGTGFFNLTSSKAKKAESMSSISDDALDYIEERFKSKKSLIGLTTGFADIDRRIHGLCEPDYIVLGGRPGMGKTTLALNIMANAAQEGARCLYFSLEMSKRQLALKMLSTISGINFGDLLHGRVRDGDWPKLVRAKELMANLPITIDDSSGMTSTQIRASAKTHAIRDGVDLVIVDHMHLMRDEKTSKMIEVMGEASRSFKEIAKDLNIPFLALCQLNRSLDGRTDKRPIMSDLRESGTIEQDADVIGFIYRDDVYNPADDNPDKGVAEVIFRKVRLGEPGTERLVWDGGHSCFKNFTEWS